MNTKYLTKKIILENISNGIIIPEKGKSNKGLKKTHLKEVIHILKQFDQNDSFDQITKCMKSDEFTSDRWGSLDTIKAYRRSIERLSKYLNDYPLEEILQSKGDINESPEKKLLQLQTISVGEVEKNYSLEDITKKIESISNLCRDLLQTFKAHSSRHELFGSLTKLIIIELEKEIKIIKELDLA